MAALRFETVGLRFGKAAELLSDLSFSVARGELALVIGAAGAGKSSLLALAALRLAPSRGIVCLFDRDGAGLGPRERRVTARRVGVAGAGELLVDELDIGENIGLPLRIAGIGRDERGARCGGALARIGLGGRGADRPAALSAAERARAVLARATIHTPELLLVDDVDAPGDAAELTRRLRALTDAAARGTAVIATTGRADLADHCPGASIYRLDRGRLSGAALARRGAA